MSSPDNHTAYILESTGDIEAALRFHCAARLFPPVHPVFIPAFIDAIESVNAGDYGAEIELPNGKVMQAGEIIRSANLYNFITGEEY